MGGEGGRREGSGLGDAAGGRLLPGAARRPFALLPALWLPAPAPGAPGHGALGMGGPQPLSRVRPPSPQRSLPRPPSPIAALPPFPKCVVF